MTHTSNLVLLHNNGKKGTPLEVCETFRSHVEKQFSVSVMPFKNFGKHDVGQSTLVIFVTDGEYPEDLEKVFKFLDRQQKGFLKHLRFSMMVFGDEAGEISSKHHQNFSKLRAKMIEKGAFDILGESLEVFSINANAAIYLPVLLTELQREVNSTPEKRRPSFVAPVSWALLDPSSREFQKFADKFRRHVPISSQHWSGDRMENCFIGSEAVDWICQNAEPEFEVTREQAVGIGQKMFLAGVFSHVTNELAFKDRNIIFRLHQENVGTKKWKAPADWA